jgi:protein ImuA
MNKLTSDSAALASAGWGHALVAMGGAAMGEADGARQSLADIIAALPANACHEVFASEQGDVASMMGFGAMLALMLAGDAPCFFVRPPRRDGMMLYPAGLAELGIDPARCFCVHAPDLLAALRATADIARSDAAGAVLVEVDGNPRLLDLTASRRLALAAEKSGTAVLLLRSGAREAASAAFSRWQVSSAPSIPLEANAPGGAAFAVTLLRHRRVAAGLEARLVWNFEERRFDEQPAITAPLREAGEAALGSVVPLAARRAAGSRARRAA